MDRKTLEKVWRARSIPEINRILESDYNIYGDINVIKESIVDNFCADNEITRLKSMEDVILHNFNGGKLVDWLYNMNIPAVEEPAQDVSMKRIESYAKEKDETVAEPEPYENEEQVCPDTDLENAIVKVIDGVQKTSNFDGVEMSVDDMFESVKNKVLKVIKESKITK